jgi:aerobic carbon-monoxide dehydrogenase medium subunit
VAATIGDVQVRNRGTVGGNVCVNDPTNHLPPLLAALGATMTIRSSDGERDVSADEFFVGVYVTAVGEGELLTRIAVPPRAQGVGDGFAAVTIGAHGTCIANAAVTTSPDGVRIALGCVAAVPVLVTTADTDAATVKAAVRAVGLDPPGDVHASADYRRHLAETCAARAADQARGGA